MNKIEIKAGNNMSIVWERGKCWAFDVRENGQDTGWDYKNNVVRDLVIEADGCLDDYDAVNEQAPELNPACADIRDEDIIMDFSKYMVHYDAKGLYVSRFGQNASLEQNPALTAMARIVNLLRQDMAAKGIERRP